jgi:hypothetical protein
VVLHSPQSGECGLAVLGECRSERRVGEGTRFWLCGWGTAGFPPVADVGCRPGLWCGRRFFFHRWRGRRGRPLCLYRHIYRPRHRRRSGSFSTLAHVLHSLPQAVSASPSISSISHLSHDSCSQPASRRVRPRAVACSYVVRVTYGCFLCMASPEIFRLAAGGHRVLPCPRFRASTPVRHAGENSDSFLRKQRGNLKARSLVDFRRWVSVRALVNSWRRAWMTDCSPAPSIAPVTVVVSHSP